MKLQGKLKGNKTIVLTGAGSDRKINVDARWDDPNCKDGDEVSYEWTLQAGVTIIYGDLRGSLEKLVVAVDEKKPEKIEPTSVKCSEGAALHSWECHTPAGIFAAKASNTAYVGDNVAMFGDISLEALKAIIAKECAAVAEYTWQHKDRGQKRGRHGDIEMICTDIDGKTFSIDSCYPKDKKVSKAVIEAALKAHATDYAKFLTALGKY
ncbi:hypothetical protein ACO0LM_20035 [Undibacterium sp. Di26W]|uniref:hypothetical protein n=1 Tax=Undibacterium sp. Di26W TaxID=3413035 RepID=UPI003BF1909F